MRPSEKIVWLILLERSDNANCTVPAFMTPSLAQLSDAVGYSRSTTAEALAHLERHGWIYRERSKGGRGHKTGYRLTAGEPCEAGCLESLKQSDGPDCLPEKQSDGPDQKQSDLTSPNPRSDPVSDVGHRRGRVKEGTASQPDWTLIQRLVRIVHNDPCGGLHRGELAEKLGMPAHGEALTTALMIAYRKKQIDFCRQYVVKPGRPA
jgi:helix-turn-helix protein